MYETCKSCGTIFDLDESTLSNKIEWLKCSVCNQKWSMSNNYSEDFEKNDNKENKVSKLVHDKMIDETEKVKSELASIKSAVENKTKIMSQINNPILNVKNKSVAEISSELTASKLEVSHSNQNKAKDRNSKKNKNISKKLNFFPIISLFIILLFTALLFLRSALLSYSYLYLPLFTEKYAEKINSIFNTVELPILAELNHINMTDFVATVQEDKIKFVGLIKNSSSRPILVPRIKVLAIREGREILMEKIIVINHNIIRPYSVIEFKEFIKIKPKNENITLKATLLKKVF